MQMNFAQNVEHTNNIGENKMDTGNGKFEQFDPKDLEEMLEQHPQHGGVFKVGEIVELKGSRFRVQSIKPKGLRLKLLQKKENIEWVPVEGREIYCHECSRAGEAGQAIYHLPPACKGD